MNRFSYNNYRPANSVIPSVPTLGTQPADIAAYALGGMLLIVGLFLGLVGLKLGLIIIAAASIYYAGMAIYNSLVKGVTQDTLPADMPTQGNEPTIPQSQPLYNGGKK